MAIWVIAVVAVAPCQCFSPGANQTISPGRISSLGPPTRCAQPQPYVTMSVWPSGCVCQAVRAPGSNVTMTAPTRAGWLRWNRESIRTDPVKYSAGPLPDGSEPARLISIAFLLQPGTQSMRAISAQTRSRLNPDYRRAEEFIAERGAASNHPFK